MVGASIQMYGVWWVRQYKCTECGGCANLNVQSVVGVSIQMYRVWWVFQYKCTECGGWVHTNVQSVVHALCANQFETVASSFVIEQIQTLPV